MAKWYIAQTEMQKKNEPIVIHGFMSNFLVVQKLVLVNGVHI